MNPSRFSVALLIACGLFAATADAEEARLLRFPTVHGDKVAFSYAGDLYADSAEVGIARRLTNHDGYEMFPRFSPDGTQIAFTAQYDGNTEVYVMPAEGGEPKRLTYTATLSRDDIGDRMGPNNIVMGWTPDGKKILFRSRMRSFNDFLGKLYLIDVEGGLPEELPLPHGGFGSFSPDGKKLVYNRVMREFRTWKRYRGGMADDLWGYDSDAGKVTRLLENPAQDIIPMWHGEKIFFLSDRDDARRMNLYSHDLNTGQTAQLTEFTEFDVKFPSLGGDAIVFENGGYIWKYEIPDGRLSQLHVQIHNDFPAARGGLTDVSDGVSNYEISHDGKHALFGARGDVFTVPDGPGRTRNLTASPGVHERDSKWSPDGKHIAYISDATGEDELYLEPATGGPAKQLTTGSDTYKYGFLWSPDSKKILWSDKKLRLQYVDVESKKVTLVDQADAWEITSFAWSPDSAWVAFSRQEIDSMSRVYVFSVADGKSHAVTEGWYNATSPCFSAEGKYLFFVSQRDFNPIYSQTEWNHAYQDMARIYLVTLRQDTRDPLKPPAVGEEDQEEKADKVEVSIDFDGIAARTLQLPIGSANYRSLTAVGDSLYYNRSSANDPGPSLRVFDMKKREETTLGAIPGYEISADGKKMLVSMGGKYGIVDLPKGPVELKKPLDLSKMEVKLDRQAEWAQIFRECWRQMRDFFYAPNMHGIDWEAVRKKYEPLVSHVRHRNDLNYVIGEMIGELNVGHAYIGGGDTPEVERIQTGLLGAELTRDEQTGYYKLARILKGENWDSSKKSPLRAVGVNVKEGEYLLAINGTPVNEVSSPFELLVGQVGEPVTLLVNGEPKQDGAREVTVTPIADEAPLYYDEWVRGNIEKVAEATEGKVGYLHVPDMGPGGLNEFIKHFYPQITRKALIIDVRGNGGGNVSPMLIERLRREIAMVGMARNGPPTIDPAGTFHGPMVCLLNEFSASDGDLFPWRFRHYKLGPLIGKRSWGGVVGIRGSLPLIDGGDLRKPEFSRYDIAGKEWIIEGYGVDPDIEVENEPVAEYRGTDAQLNRGIAELLEKLKAEGKALPAIPPFPKR